MTKMSSEVMTDPHLAQHEKFYICNKMGTIVAALEPAGQVAVSSGMVRFRWVWELSEPWARFARRMSAVEEA